MSHAATHVEMPEDRGVIVGRGGVAEFWRPFAWTAIVGGTVTALGIQLILTLLGVGIGMAMADTIRSNDAPEEAGMGAIAWLIISGIISFGAGGWVAGRMSGYLRTGSGALHGIAAWALAAVFGVTVAAISGSPVIGGAAAGAGAGAGAFAGERMGNVSYESSASSSASADGRDARGFTEEEAALRADQARRVIAQASLWTSVAFLLSMVAGGVGGTLGRKDMDQITRKDHTRDHARSDHVRTA